MALFQSDSAKGLISVPWPSSAGVVTAYRDKFTFPNTIAINDIVEMCILPAGARIVDVVLDSDDLDTDGTPTITLDVGFMSGEAGKNDGARTCAKEFLDASTIAQTGGVARPTLKTAFRTGKSDVARGVGVKVAAAGTAKAAGEVGLTIFYTA